MSGKINLTRDKSARRVKQLTSKNGFMIRSFGGEGDIASTLAEIVPVPDEMP